MTKKFCVNGHNVEECGRWSNGTCRACGRTGGKNGRPYSPYCMRGHNKDKVGRRHNGHCAECARANERRRKHKKTGRIVEPKHVERLDWAPIEHLLKQKGVKLSAYFNYKSIRQWQKLGVPVLTADRICIDRLGMHPATVYGNAFYGIEEAI